MDIFYVNRIPFLITKENIVNYITVSHLKNRSKTLIIKSINMVKRTYLTRGFKISDYHSDNEFDNDDIRLILLSGQLQVCAQGEHVPRIERAVRTVKNDMYQPIMLYYIPNSNGNIISIKYGKMVERFSF